MTRYLPIALVVGLLVGSAAAFAVTERLKLETSPISRTRIAQVFSPVCNCPTDRARLAFRLAKSDRVTVAIVDRHGTAVRTLFVDRPWDGLHRFSWDGRDDAGRRAPDGPYRLRIQLSELDRTFVPPETINVDTVPPRIVATSVYPHVFSPDGDHRNDGIVVGYRLGEQARLALFVNGVRRVRTRLQPPGVGRLRWYGRVNGHALPKGDYRLELMARDLAGNRSTISAGTVRLRYISIQGQPIEGVVGRRTRVFVSTDARTYTWQVGSRSGIGRRRLLRLPRLPAGRHRLVVSANGHRDAATVVIRKRGG